MTKEEFDQLGSEYGLFIHRDSEQLYLKPQYIWVDIPVMTFEEGKVHISIKLNENGDLYRFGNDIIIVSEVSTARFFLNEMMKQRKQILENKKLAKIQEDFQFCKQKFTKNINLTIDKSQWFFYI